MPPLPARPGRDRADQPRADRSVRCERSTRPPRNGLRMKVGRPCPEYGVSVRSADALAGDVQRHDAITIATPAVGRDDRTGSNPQRRRSPTCAVLVHPRPCPLARSPSRGCLCTGGVARPAPERLLLFCLASFRDLASTDCVDLGRDPLARDVRTIRALGDRRPLSRRARPNIKAGPGADDRLRWRVGPEPRAARWASRWSAAAASGLRWRFRRRACVRHALGWRAASF